MSRSSRRWSWIALVLVAALVPSGRLQAQYRVVSPAGDTILLDTDRVREMLDSTRALRLDLEQDPRVLYALGYGDVVTGENPHAAWPWNAIAVRSDSVVEVTTPGNLREADRAYANYSVMRMRVIRSRDPDAACDSIVAWEAGAVSSFIDGWIVARTLFGGPPFAPLDALAFARLDRHLAALIADSGDEQIGACAEEWTDAHPDAIEAYRSWHERQFPPPKSEVEVVPADQEEPEADPAGSAGGSSLPAEPPPGEN